MLIHNRIERSRVNGPGVRATIWLQGCLLNCRSCWNPQTHDFNAGQVSCVRDVMDWILNIDGIEGVTFSGGEPMHQAHELWVLLHALRLRRPELSLGMFTGYSEAELEKGAYKYRSMGESSVPERFDAATPTWWAGIKQLLDFVVAGRYVESMTTKALPMVSSTNQKLILLSQRYQESDFPRQGVEVHIAKDGKSAKLTGFPVGVRHDVRSRCEVVGG